MAGLEDVEELGGQLIELWEVRFDGLVPFRTVVEYLQRRKGHCDRVCMCVCG